MAIVLDTNEYQLKGQQSRIGNQINAKNGSVLMKKRVIKTGQKRKRKRVSSYERLLFVFPLMLPAGWWPKLHNHKNRPVHNRTKKNTIPVELEAHQRDVANAESEVKTCQCDLASFRNCV